MKTIFKQTSKIGQAGSFINQLMSNNSSLPEVGKGATILGYTDRYCYEVVGVSKDLKTVKLQALEAVAFRENLQTGHQSWELKPTENYKTIVWRNNKWNEILESVCFTKEFIKEAEENGFSLAVKYLSKEMKEEIYQGEIFPQKVVEKITKLRREYSKLNILFGVKDYYYDWSF